MDSISDVQASVAALLHEQLQRRTPGSPGYEIAEKALSLVFSPARRAHEHAPFLHRNVTRDAARILRRARARRPEGVLEEPLDVPDHAMATPEEVVQATQLATRLREAARPIHPAAVECFDGLLAQETLAETSARTGLSTPEVKALRTRIRDAARQALRNAA
jgi:DNA-directed RNA polymerase specialized sigma24 family protein